MKIFDTVPSTDVNFVIDGFNSYLEKMTKEKSFNVTDFFKVSEKNFISADYRTKKLGGRGEILIIHDAGVGDFIMMSAAIREIRRIYPKAYIRLVIFPRAADMAEFCPYVDEVIYNRRSTDWRNFISLYKWNTDFVRKLLNRRIDICFAFSHYASTILLMYMCGAKERVSFDFTGGVEDWNGLTSAVPLDYLKSLATCRVPKFFSGTHHVDVNFAMVDYILRLPVENRSLEVWYTPQDLNIAREILSGVPGNVYALVMGGTGAQKKYPPEKYAEFVKLVLKEESDSTFVILGGGNEDLQAVEILKQNFEPEVFTKHFIDLTNKLHYRQSAAILNFCDMYIGNDTSPLHMASAVKCPILALYAGAKDLPESSLYSAFSCAPYKVPSVVVRPEHALSECLNDKNFSPHGCKVTDRAHCITQITPETLIKGFHLLKERISAKINEPLFM